MAEEKPKAAAVALPSFSLSKVPLAAKVALGALLTGLVGAAYWTLFFGEISDKITAEVRKTGTLNSEMKAQQGAQASYFADREDLALHQQRQRELNKLLPADTEVAAFLSSLQQISNASGIDLKSWQPLDEQLQPFYAKVPMRLSFSGHFYQIAKFIYEIGKLERITNLENISLQDPKSDNENEVTLKVTCLATTFHSLKGK